jgi:molybdopterin synthase sulfur carrier subunit
VVIRVKGYLTFRKLVGDRSVDVGAEETLLTLLETLTVEIGDPFRHQVFAGQGGLQERVAVLVNGRSYSCLPEGLETRLQDGDEVAIFPPVMGG